MNSLIDIETLLRAGDYIGAASLYAKIDIDSHFSNLSDKVEHLLLISGLYLQGEDNTSSESYLASAVALANTGSVPRGTQLQLYLAQATNLDKRARFSESSSMYLKLAEDAELDQEKRIIVMQRASICALISSGLVRDTLVSRIVGLAIFSFMHPALSMLVTKIKHGDVIELDEMKAAESLCEPHHMALTANNMPMFINHLLEYNIISCVGEVAISQVAERVGMSEECAEDFLVSMIAKKRVRARVSHRKRIVVFEQVELESGKKIQDFCERVSRLADRLSLV